MPSDHEDGVSSKEESDTSDDTDSQDSYSMPRRADTAGVCRKSNNGHGKKASGEPKREKRKKAKRACRPCQVAHLTCGDERPCLRCVKRGCSHMCKDGVRKKAKYLQDTPAEALTQELGTRGRPPVSSTHNFIPRQALPDLPGGIPPNLYGGPGTYNPYPSTGQHAFPLSPLGANPQNFGNQSSRLPSSYGPIPGQPPLPMQSYGNALQEHTAPNPDPLLNDFDFGPFELDYLDNLNFGNRFAAAEFGILGTMTSGMANSPPSDSTGAFHPGSGHFTPTNVTGPFGQSPINIQPYPYRQNQGTSPWPTDAQQDASLESGTQQSGGRASQALDLGIQQESSPAFAIGAEAYLTPTSGSSPQGTMGGYDDGATSGNAHTNINLQHQTNVRLDTPSHWLPQASASAAPMTTSALTKDQTLPSRRHRNPSEVYNNVKQPHSYTTGFHSLSALIQGRFSPHKTARIAKALAAIRPSFISCTMRLNGDDLVFMEKCLQRTLWGLEDVISATSTPTIICRRTGEVVAAGKEFSILTGWSKDVLLGKAPNLNVNRGGDTSGLPGSGASSRGPNTMPWASDQRPAAPVNIVNLLDDDSACDFFDDYAHLAFGDSRGTVTTPCKLLKYKTIKDMDLDNDTLDDEIGSRLKQQRDANLSGKSGAGRGEVSMHMLGQQDGKVECMLCWTVKRDVFDIPMLFVMNVLPCI